jgi:hypothetical protein
VSAVAMSRQQWSTLPRPAADRSEAVVVWQGSGVPGLDWICFAFSDLA